MGSGVNDTIANLGALTYTPRGYRYAAYQGTNRGPASGLGGEANGSSQRGTQRISSRERMINDAAMTTNAN